MSYELPTVAIDLDGQMVIINARDFDASIHKAWDEEQEEEHAPAESESSDEKPAAKRGRHAAN